jgi:hypothetical protein
MDMAFNPFRAFRKRQKTLLAGIAILCMFLFVLQFGRGDFFDRIGLSRGKQRDNVVVTKLYGKKITENDIRLAREQHRLASQFMVVAAGEGMIRNANQTAELRKNLTQPGSGNIDRLMALQKQSGKLINTLIRYFAQTDDPNSQRLVLQQMGGFLQLLFSNPSSELIQMIRNNMQLISIDDTLDFMIWKHQADQLGINLTESSIEEAVKNLTFDEVDLRDVEKSFLVRNRDQETGLSREQLYDAVGDLLRVNLAKEALIGSPQGLGSAFDPTAKTDLKETNSLITPDEFWDFYKQQRTTREIGILSFPVKNFLDQVKGEPSEKDLEQFFKRFKEVEYSPTSNRPGFKKPRRVGLEWVGARSDSPEYKKFADDFILASVASSPLNPWPAIALAYDFEKDYQEGVKANRVPRYDRQPYQLPEFQFPGSTFEPTLITSPNEPANLAGTLASAASGRPWSALVTYTGAPVAREIHKRAAIGANFVLLGTNPWKLATAVSLAYQKGKFVPLSEVGEEAAKKLKKSIAQDMVISNLNSLKKDMEEKRTKNEKVADWLKDSLAKYHFTTHGVMKKPLSKYEMLDDAELKAFKDIYQRLNTKSPDEPRGDPKAERFADSFFAEGANYEPKDWPSYSVGGSPTTWASEEEPIVYWKTADEKSYVPTFEAARAKVEKAWRFREARNLARAEAERVAELAKATNGDVQKLRDLAAKKMAEFIELRGVALIHKASPSARADLSARYEDFKFPDSISMPKEGQFGQGGFLAALAGLKSPGDTVVEGNQPETIIFVSTLISKQEPSLASFYDAYRNAKSEANRDVLLESWMQGQRLKFRYDIMKQLREEASPDVVDGRWDIPADTRKRFQTRADDSSE